jgi:hypothetical protein
MTARSPSGASALPVSDPDRAGLSIPSGCSAGRIQSDPSNQGASAGQGQACSRRRGATETPGRRPANNRTRGCRSGTDGETVRARAMELQRASAPLRTSPILFRPGRVGFKYALDRSGAQQDLRKRFGVFSTLRGSAADILTLQVPVFLRGTPTRVTPLPGGNWHYICSSFLQRKRVKQENQREGRIDRIKHDDDIAERVIGGVRSLRGPASHVSTTRSTADDRPRPKTRRSPGRP